MNVKRVVEQLKAMSDPANKEAMARFGIKSDKAFGIKIPVLRAYAKEIKKNHELAIQLWETGIHEARLLAIFLADKHLLDEHLMEHWLSDFDSWDICDQACGNLFDRHPTAYEKAIEWTSRDPEFQKRAGFAMMATLAVHDKKADDLKFIQFLPFIEKHAFDNRNFVKKAVNWALRQIGKRNPSLKQLALQSAARIKDQNTPSARWIASDAIRELLK